MQLKHQKYIIMYCNFYQHKKWDVTKKFKHKIGNIKMTYHVRPNKNPEKEECM